MERTPCVSIDDGKCVGIPPLRAIDSWCDEEREWRSGRDDRVKGFSKRTALLNAKCFYGATPKRLLKGLPKSYSSHLHLIEKNFTMFGVSLVTCGAMA